MNGCPRQNPAYRPTPFSTLTCVFNFLFFHKFLVSLSLTNDVAYGPKSDPLGFLPLIESSSFTNSLSCKEEIIHKTQFCLDTSSPRYL